MSLPPPDYRPAAYRKAAARSLRNMPEGRESVGSATRTFDARRTEAYSAVETDRWREWARDVKGHALTRHEEYLEQAASTLV
ncbi:MAG: hypothetical protein OXU33_02800, partial [Gemmatimonadota bacterium]|nr:hypothetical protein [Gemmatimonadota bacterium]